MTFHSKSAPSLFRAIPSEILLMVGAALGLFITVGTGSLIAAGLQAGSPWLFMLAYAVPGAIVFVIYWLIARSL